MSQYPESVNSLLLQALLCVSHNGKITDAILTGFGGCFEMLKNFGYHVSGASPASMVSSLRAAVLATMNQLAPPAPVSVGGFFAVGIVNRACVSLQAVVRRKVVSLSRLGALDYSASLASRVHGLKTRAAAALLPDQVQTPAPGPDPTPAPLSEDILLSLKSTRDLHMSKAPGNDLHVAVASSKSEDAPGSQIPTLHAAELASGPIATDEEVRRKKLALHQQVRCPLVLYVTFYIVKIFCVLLLRCSRISRDSSGCIIASCCWNGIGERSLWILSRSSNSSSSSSSLMINRGRSSKRNIMRSSSSSSSSPIMIQRSKTPCLLPKSAAQSEALLLQRRPIHK
jgi:hypothetical protein